MEPARSVEAGFSPLDLELELSSSALTPQCHQGLVLLGALVPSFAQAAKHLETLLRVKVSQSTVRRLTEEAGSCLQQWQDQQAHPLASDQSEENVAARLVMATDGVLVPVRPKEWKEVKMVTIGEVQEGKEDPHCERLSYFARLTEASTFADLAACEIRRRGVERASEVATVQDGAEWIVGFVQGHRADAVRILDFAHAAQYITEIAEVAKSAGAQLEPSWQTVQLHTLKHEGPQTVLPALEQLCAQFPVPEMQEKLTYLSKRQAQMDYPLYRAAGWPIGSGMAQSGNKLVVQARLKGAGMHWEERNVNPMLALRTTLCSDRWHEGWKLIRAGWHTRHIQRLVARAEGARERASARLRHTLLHLPLPLLLALFPPLPAKPTEAPKGRTEAQKRWGRQTFSSRRLRQQALAKK
jgi:hypothetical protein